MSHSGELKRIQRVIKAQPEHDRPKADLLLGELRSDYGLPPPTPTKQPVSDAVIVAWQYDICLRDFDAFHTFLADTEANLAADVEDLNVGATYQGTFAQLPQGNPHHTHWAYTSVEAIDAFKAALAKNKKSDLYKNFAKLVGFIDCCCTLRMHRYYRAGLLADQVTAAALKDPILGLFAGKKSSSKK